MQGIVRPCLAGHDQATRQGSAHLTAPEVMPAMNCLESTI
jgi:hypothetical protein